MSRIWVSELCWSFVPSVALAAERHAFLPGLLVIKIYLIAKSASCASLLLQFLDVVACRHELGCVLWVALMLCP